MGLAKSSSLNRILPAGRVPALKVDSETVVTLEAGRALRLEIRPLAVRMMTGGREASRRSGRPERKERFIRITRLYSSGTREEAV